MNSENYIMPFSKYKSMKLSDVMNIKIVDQNGDEKRTGELYLKWLINQDWFKYKDIVSEALTKNNINGYHTVDKNVNNQKK